VCSSDLVSNDQSGSRITSRSLNSLKDRGEPARLNDREDSPLNTTTDRRVRNGSNCGQRPRELTGDDRALDDLDAARDNLLIGEEAADRLLDPATGLAAGDQQAACLDVESAAVAAQLGRGSSGIADGGQTDFTIVAEVSVDLGFNSRITRPGLQPRRQRAHVFN